MQAHPTLFLLFINDLPQALSNVGVAIFADDVKLYSSNPAYLQAALSDVQRWCQKWQLSLAEQKCSFLSIGVREVLPAYPYRINATILSYAAVQRDLGIILTTNLDFTQHYSTIVKRASRASYHILKCFTTRRPRVMAAAFAVYVRPILETFAPVWNPVLRKHIIWC